MQLVSDEQREEFVKAAVAALEASLPSDVPPRRGGERAVWDVLLDGLQTTETRAALRDLAGGAGGELRPSRAGNVAFCSAESSALMAVNFLAPFISHGGLTDDESGVLSFEHALPVTGVRSRVSPHLDAVWQSDGGTTAFEFKVMEPWRDKRTVSISEQYDGPAERVSSKTRALLDDLRSGRPTYRWLDAAQLVRHLLGIHSALLAGTLPSPATLVLAFWQPTDPGWHENLFTELQREFEDFAARLDDQPISLVATGTADLLNNWSAPNQPPSRTCRSPPRTVRPWTIGHGRR